MKPAREYLPVLSTFDASGATILLLWSVPVAQLQSATRHLSRPVNEHERAHEDVTIVLKPAELVSFSAKTNRALVEFHPLMAACVCRIHESLILEDDDRNQFGQHRGSSFLLRKKENVTS